MTITDEQYSQLAEHSYWVEEGRNDVDYHPQEQKKYYYNKDEKSLGQYQVLAVEDNTTNGMQAMAVAPIVNGKVDTSQVVVAYAGTNFSDSKDVEMDLQQVIEGLNSDVALGSIENGGFKLVPNQLETANDFYVKVKTAYPQASLTVTGHSLGGYLALNIAAKHGVPATTFNAPDPINGMSEETIKWVKANRQLYNNYRINLDLIGNMGAYFNEVFSTDELNISRNVANKNWSLNPLENHSLAAFRFDAHGRVIDGEGQLMGSQYLSSKSYDAVLKARLAMGRYQQLKSDRKRTGGGISRSEEFFLDGVQGRFLSSQMAEAARSGLDELKRQKEQMDKEIENLWSHIHFHEYSALSQWEVIDLFSSQGIDYGHFVEDFKSYTAQTVNKMGSQTSTFERLASTLNRTIEQLEAVDQELGREFGE